MSFDAIAPHYRWMERLLAGKKLHCCRTTFLGEIPIPKKILLAGEGHGRALVECCRRFPSAEITCLDESERMLQQAASDLRKRDAAAHSRVTFIQADARSWRPLDGKFDLIVTNFFLDCFSADELDAIVASFTALSTPQASWLVADFQSAPAGIRRWRSEAILWLMYRVFRMVTNLSAGKLTPPDAALSGSGFALRRRVESEWNLLRSDWWQREESNGCLYESAVAG